MNFKECLELGVDFMDVNDPGIVYGISVYGISEYIRTKKSDPSSIGVIVFDSFTNRAVEYISEENLEKKYGKDFIDSLGKEK